MGQAIRLPARTRPSPQLRRLRQTSRDRILFYIAKDANELSFISNPVIVRLILPERLSGSPQKQIGVPCRRTLQPSSDNRQLGPREHQNVYMIRHDDPSKEIIKMSVAITALNSTRDHGRNPRVFQPNGPICIPMQQAVVDDEGLSPV